MMLSATTPNEHPRRPELAHVSLPKELVAYRDARTLTAHLEGISGITVELIGTSRSGQPLYGYTLGRGPRIVTVTAGCHADEPIGPMTAQALPALIRTYTPDLLDAWTFRVVPQMNPDGADQNRAWFADPPDFETYLARTYRELPGDDIEFGFSTGPEARPECRAAIPFLWSSPVAAHFSLHGMAWAEGAWFLLNEAWVDRAGPLMDDLAWLCAAYRLPRMEIDREGEKGFRRIGEGFSTSPTSVAMKAHFEALGDPGMAAKFAPSSMESAEGAGGDPLCIVSELPLFLLEVPPSLERPVLYEFRDALEAARASKDRGALADLAERFCLRSLPLDQQIAVQFSMLVLGLDHVCARRSR